MKKLGVWILVSLNYLNYLSMYFEHIVFYFSGWMFGFAEKEAMYITNVLLKYILKKWSCAASLSSLKKNVFKKEDMKGEYTYICSTLILKYWLETRAVIEL